MTTPNIEELIADFPEINPANYGDDEINTLNAWGIAAHAALQSQTERIKELEVKAREIEALRAKMVPLAEDAARYQALMMHCKSKHIWNHVFTNEQQTLGNSVESVLDALVAMGITGEPK